MKIFNTMRPQTEDDYKNFNFLPYYSIFKNNKRMFLNIGLFHICIQFELK